MLSGFDHTGPTRSVVTCSMSELIHSCQILLQTGKPLSPSKNTVWKRIADSPYGSPSCTTVCRQLVVVEVKLARILQQLSLTMEKTGTWLAMESMTTPQYKALVASLQDKVMMVVGGKIGNDRLATVEIAKVL